MVSRAGLDVLEERKIYCCAGIRTSGHPAHCLITTKTLHPGNITFVKQTHIVGTISLYLGYLYGFDALMCFLILDNVPFLMIRNSVNCV
jgi:hypothetical protein